MIELVPLGAVDLHGKCIGIEAGPRNHRQNLAIARVHGDDRAVAIAQRQLCRALQIVVDGQPQILPRHRMLDAEIAHFASVAVHNHFARPVLAAQQFVVSLFHARLAHHVARLVVGEARVVQIVFAHFAHVANQVRGKSIARIKPAFHVNRLQLGQFVAVRRDKGLLVGGHVLLDGNRLVSGLGAIVMQRGAQLVHIRSRPLAINGRSASTFWLCSRTRKHETEG